MNQQTLANLFATLLLYDLHMGGKGGGTVRGGAGRCRQGCFGRQQFRMKFIHLSVMVAGRAVRVSES